MECRPLKAEDVKKFRFCSLVNAMLDPAMWWCVRKTFFFPERSLLLWKSAVSGRKTDGVEPSRVKAIVMEAVKYWDMEDLTGKFPALVTRLPRLGRLCLLCHERIGRRAG